jgi:DnaJ-class molecular chaperone
VQVPTQLSAEQRRLFEELSATFGTSTKAETAKSGKGFFERVADFLSGEG